MMKALIIGVALTFSPFVYADEVTCLAKNIYYEARNQSVQGMYAVADVTLNRVKDKRWPGTVCEVVKQRRNTGGKWICQFSWYCDGKSDTPETQSIYNLCTMIAYVKLKTEDSSVLPQDVYWYHAKNVDPYWASAYRRYTTIGDHTFYSDSDI